MRAADRKARDAIALLIRCSYAQTYFMNSKIIARVGDDEETLAEDESNALNPKVYSVSDVLCELEYVKRELSNQIELNRNLEHDNLNLTTQVALAEEEMNSIINESPQQSVLDANESVIESSHGSRARTELKHMTR